MSRHPPPSAEEPSLRPGERGRARRRLRHLRQLRELQLRDLGGFVLDLYRFGQQRDRLVREKLDAIIATDKETHALEALLGSRERTYAIRQPGVGGTCPSCGELHASAARFCARCGLELGKAARGEADRPEPGTEARPAEEAPRTEVASSEEPGAEAAPAEAGEDRSEEPPAEAPTQPTPALETPAGDEPDWPEPDPSPPPAEAVELESVRRRRAQT